jgi:hypothetical protein
MDEETATSLARRQDQVLRKLPNGRYLLANRTDALLGRWRRRAGDRGLTLHQVERQLRGK